MFPGEGEEVSRGEGIESLITAANLTDVPSFPERKVSPFFLAMD